MISEIANFEVQKSELKHQRVLRARYLSPSSTMVQSVIRARDLGPRRDQRAMDRRHRSPPRDQRVTQVRNKRAYYNCKDVIYHD